MYFSKYIINDGKADLDIGLPKMGHENMADVKRC